MSSNSESSVPRSSSTNQDDGSGNNTQKPPSPNTSGSCQNDTQRLVHGGGDEPGKNTARLFGLESVQSPPGADNRVTPSQSQPKMDDISEKGLFRLDSEKKPSSNAKDEASQTSHNQKKPSPDPQEMFRLVESSLAPGSYDSVPGTTQSSVSSGNTSSTYVVFSQHSSNQDTETEAETIAGGNRSSTYDVFGLGSSSDSVPGTTQSSVSSEHSSNQDTETGRLQPETIPRGNTPSTYDVFGTRNAQNK